ncbi:MAG: alpha/beta hydrolase [Hyphomicrobiales bacterium]|uniref:alpha/beta fold hydrolase n=1 Tax=Rhabdaerophilum calidifontis TaxID=2604328 RepID=UPI001239F9BA|nr:alpha/beta hydrolase [Rhabdaerophilum calidifontis]MCA1953150.1 alpha/beta hydrolase [Hyphomicrobiales bacterium]MCA1999983.1 alpha/beta hydrolase [Hyphomicrobiales bacterium]
MPTREKTRSTANLHLVVPNHAWNSRFVTARDGLRLHVATLGAAASARLPVVCLPGLTRCGADFDMIGRALAETGNRFVMALDSRGRGASEYDPDWRNYDLKVELDDLQQVLVAFGIERAIFLGTSRGGLLTMLMGIARPEMIAGAVLNDIGAVIEPRGLARIRSYVGKMPAPRDFPEAMLILRQLFGTHFTDTDEAAWLRFAERTWREESGRLIPRYDVNLMRTLADLDLERPIPPLWPQFATLAHARLLVIRGELSDILARRTAEEMVARHPDARLHEVPYQGHAPLLEDAPTIAAIRDFVERCG